MSINPVNRLQVQAFLLGSNSVTAGTAATLSGTAATPLIIDDIVLNSVANIGAICEMANNNDQSIARVTDIRVSGQSFFASSGDMPLAAFIASGKLDGQRSLGATIDTNQLLEIEIASTKAFSSVDPVSFTASCAPIPPGGQVVSPNDLPGQLLSYCYGLGSNLNIASGATDTLSATCLRDSVTIGRLVGALAYNAGPATEASAAQVKITSVKADGIELLSSRSPSTENIGFDAVLASASDKTGLNINYTLSLNSTLAVEVQNTSPNNCSVVMGAFCRPFSIGEFQ